MMSMRRILQYFLVFLLASQLIGCGGKEERKAKYMKEGQELLKAGNYEKAKLAFKNVLQIDPKDLESRYQMGETLSKMGDMQGAFGQWMSVVNTDPKHLMARIRAGQILLLAKQAEEAEKMAAEALALAPDNAEAMVLMAGVLAAQGKQAEAVTKAQEALLKKPDDLGAIMMMASLNAKSGKPEEAIAALTAAVAKNPAATAPRLMLANIYLQTQDKAKAEQQLIDIIAADPPNLEHRKRLVMFYLSDKQLDKAEAVIRNAIRDLPDNQQADLMLIDFLTAQRSPETAKAELLPMIEAEPKRYELRFKLADLEMAMKQRDAAEKTLREIIDLDKLGPSALTARNKLARIYAGTQKINQAKDLIKEVLNENPRDANALTLRGELALAENQLPQAIGDFRAILVDQPQNMRVLKLLSAAYLKSNDIQLARENMEKTLDIAPKDEQARLDLANLEFKNGNPDRGLKQLEKIVQDNPKSKLGLEALFRYRLNQKQWQETQQIAQKLQEAYPEQGLGYFLSGLGYQAEGAFDKSIGAFEQALAKQPTTIEPLTQLVKSHMALKQPLQAERKLKDILEKTPENFVAQNLLAGTYASQKKFDDAIATYRKTIKTKPEWPNSYKNLAIVHLAQKNTEAAIKTLQEGIANTRGSLELVTDLALVYGAAGQHDKVIALYEDYYKQHPDSLVAANNLASYLSDYPRDKTDLERAAKLAEPLAQSNNPEILDTVAWIAYQQGNYDKAKTLLTKIVEMKPQAAVSQYHLGMTHYRLGDKAAARAALEKAVNAKIKFAGLADAEATLKELAGQP